MREEMAKAYEAYKILKGILGEITEIPCIPKDKKLLADSLISWTMYTNGLLAVFEAISND